MVITFGRRLYGRVDEQDGTCIVTMFAHVQLLPVVPLGSYLVFEEAGEAIESIPIGFDFRSLLLGYLRAWGVLGALGAVIVGYTGIRAAADPFAAIGPASLGLGAVAGLLALYLWAGRLSDEQRAERLVYKRFAGYPLDVARLGEAREGLAARVRASIAERVKELAATGYRTSLDPAQAWRAVAVDPSVKDSFLLDAALTLARVEWSLASGAAQKSLAEAHRRIWLRVRGDQLAILREATRMSSRRRWVGPIVGAVALLGTVALYGSALLTRFAR